MPPPTPQQALEGLNSSTPGYERNEVLPWKTRLVLVHGLLKKVKRDGIAVRLLNNVTIRLGETVEKLEGLNTAQNWDDVLDVFSNAKEYFIDKADTLSFFIADISPFHLFNDIATGLKYDEDSARRLNDPCARDQLIEEILCNVGQKIANLSSGTKKGYTDKAISRGFVQLLAEISRILQGLGESYYHDQYDWRQVLSRVIQKLHTIQMPVDPVFKYTYNRVLERLDGVLNRLKDIPDADLYNKATWDSLKV
jgi:hypothetical protein